MSQDPASSPLPACPNTPNCVHEVHAFTQLPSDLSLLTVDVLRDMDAESVTTGAVDDHQISAVFKVWFFKDDVQIYIMPAQEGSKLYIRSASRVGKSDLGVNKRRVNRFLKRLRQAIADKQS